MDCRDLGHVIVAGCVPLLMRHREWYVFMFGIYCMCGIETYAFIITLIAIWRWPSRKYVIYANWDREFYRIRHVST